MADRINQKIRTRKALLAAANRLMKNGEMDFSIEQVAKEALVSTATAYRYFQNPHTLRLEAPLHFKTQKPEKVFAGIAATDWKKRVSKLLDYHLDLYLENEKEFRLFLRASLTESLQKPGSYSRGGRRILLIKEALEGIKNQLSTSQFSTLVHAISGYMGIESVIVLKDVCKLDNTKILDVWRFTVFGLINQSLK